MSFHVTCVNIRGRVLEPIRLLLTTMLGEGRGLVVVDDRGPPFRALECIPRTLARNSGADATDLLNKLRYKHAEGGLEGVEEVGSGDGVVGLPGRWYGVDCYNCDITETVENFIWEPVVVKRNALAAATEVRVSFGGKIRNRPNCVPFRQLV